MSHKFRICIAEDHTILRAGLRSILATFPDYEVVAEACDGLELIAVVKAHEPDLVIMDLSMPKVHGLDAILEIRKRDPNVKILVLTMHSGEEYVLTALQAGVLGYLLKDATPAELMLGITTVLSGRIYLSPEISSKVLEGYLEGKKTVKSASAWDTLTRREREVLKMISEGYRNKDIAEILHTSVKTVETHRTNLMKKLDLHSTAALTSYAMERGLAGR